MKAIILAAGKGTRMKSEKLKVIHHVAGRPIINYVVDTVEALGISEIFVVVGHQANLVQDTISNKNVTFVEQTDQLGTGHAVMQVEPHISGHAEDTVVVLAGDCPLIELETLSNLLAVHKESNSAATILSAKMNEPANYGRIVRGQMGSVLGIKEAKDCTSKEKLINEINTGVYTFKMKDLFEGLKKINTNNKQHEYYLTDVIQILQEKGDSVSAFCTENADQAIGINTRLDLSKINKLIYQRNNINFMLEGVSIIDPDTTYIDSTVKIGRDTIIFPFSMIEGHSVIGANCKIGPHSSIRDGHVAKNSVIPPFSKINE
jgi:bifunctional UDP-N-acetylglucosamine pyrophosphorylase / glucosamine-1-phosphate N-acetyltransferase